MQVIYVETISNPLTSVADLEAVVEFARRHQLVSMCDNTFASPVICRYLAAYAADLLQPCCGCGLTWFNT